MSSENMKIENVAFSVAEWKTVSPTRHPGKQGEALWRTVETGNVRVRVVEYSPGYIADHWCSRGHIVYVLEGELLTELKDGRKFILKEGSSYQVSDDENNPHMSRTEKGVKLFIVD
jgi:quercetin dioxygenase-like cupin family protein